MNANINESDLTRAALDRVDRGRRAFVGWFCIAGVFEGILLATFIVLADWSDPLHRLLFVVAVLVYGTIGIGLIALGCYVRWTSLRVLQAFELLGSPANR